VGQTYSMLVTSSVRLMNSMTGRGGGAGRRALGGMSACACAFAPLTCVMYSGLWSYVWLVSCVLVMGAYTFVRARTELGGLPLVLMLLLHLLLLQPLQAHAT